MSSRTRIGTVLVMISFILAAVFAFVPANFNTSTITWLPESAADSGALQLTREAPQSMSIETTCDMARTRDATDPAMLTTGSLELLMNDDKVHLHAGSAGDSVELALPSGDCLIRAEYSHDPPVLQLSVGDARDDVAVSPPVIQGLYTSDPPSVSRVDILTQETGLAASWGRWTLGLVALAALLAGAGLLWAPASLPRVGPRAWRGLVSRLAPVDGFVAAALVGLSLVAPALFDDGWIIGRSRALQDRWWFGDLYAAKDAWLPQGALHEALLSSLQAIGLDLAHLRIIVALLVALTWVLLRRGVLAPVMGESASRWPAIAATYVAFAGAWLITVRQEPVVLFLAVLALSVAVSVERSTRPGLVFVSLTAAALAITTHQTGWVAAAPALLILLSLWKEVRRDRTQLLSLVTPVVAAISCLVLAAFAAADIHTVLEGAGTIGQGAHGSGPLDELTRYNALLRGPGARLATILILLVWCLSGSLGINAASATSRRLWVLCMLWLGGLLLTASKWEWHLALYAVPAVVLAALAGIELNRRDRTTVLRLGAVLVMLGLAGAIAMTSAGGWNAGDLSNHTWAELADLIVSGSSRIYVYAVLVALLAVGLLAEHRRGRWQPAASAAMCLVILFPLGASMAWVVADATEPGWSSTGANMRQLTDSNACGVMDGLDIDTDVRVLTQQPGQESDAELVPDAFPHIEGLSTGPLAGEIPVWGTWAGVDGSMPDARTGGFELPPFQPGDAQEVTVWSAFGSTVQMAAQVVFTDSSGAETTVDITPDDTAHWAQKRVPVPDGTTDVRVRVNDQNSGFGGWVAVSSPTASSNASVSSVLRTSTGFTDPLSATLVPCMDLPDLSNGYWGRVDYLGNEGWGFNSNGLRGLTVTEVACRPDVMCLRKYDYPMANVQVTSGP